ncbi:hypothetical protein [Streptomyces sp. bgisy091]|uniref:hypothetical protein n=1 Tax=Streptomyces sp. bgisy091 TaxID=3413778 RepID=UPI003D72C527
MPTNPRPSPPASPPEPGPYPGRARLDTANARFRRGLARLRKEARHDATLITRHEEILTKAAGALEDLAAEAEAAEQTSERHRKALAAESQKLTRTLRRAVRQGVPGAHRMLKEHLARTKAGTDGQP